MKPKNPQPAQRPKYTEAQIVEMLQTNTWWPFDRVDSTILQKLHRAATTKNSPTDLGDALL